MSLPTTPPDSAREAFGLRKRARHLFFGLVALPSRWAVGLLLAVLLGCAWLVSWVLGGAGVVPPHWFYVPIVLAAIRFGVKGVLATAVVAAFLAGPVLPLSVADGTPQKLSDWVTRGAFFVAIGVFLAVMLHEHITDRLQQLQRARMYRALKRALARGDLEVHYQALYNIAGRRKRLIGAEALVRWNDPDRGCISPAVFIPIAEETDLIDGIFDFVLDDVTRQLATWVHLDDAEFISVNLSGHQLASPDLVDRIRRCVEASGINPRRLCFEVTETAAVRDIDTSRKQLQALRDLGARIAIDDFGTGYSSLAHIHLLPVDLIKIDQSFIARMVDETEASIVVGSTILLAHTLGFDALAEGVETAEQLRSLRSMGCDFVQGFHFHRPSPVDEVTRLLNRQAQRRRYETNRRARAMRVPAVASKP